MGRGGCSLYEDKAGVSNYLSVIREELCPGRSGLFTFSFVLMGMFLKLQGLAGQALGEAWWAVSSEQPKWIVDSSHFFPPVSVSLGECADAKSNSSCDLFFFPLGPLLNPFIRKVIIRKQNVSF